MRTQWKAVEGYEGLYEVSDAGQVRSLINTPRILGGSVSTRGYRQFALRREGKTKFAQAHRLVADAFLDEKPKATVNHINGDKLDNRAENLEWSTIIENVHHALANGLNRYGKCYKEYATA